MVRNYPSVFVLVLVVIGIVAADWLVLSPYWLLPAAVVFFMAAAYAVSRQRRSTGIALMGLTFCFVSAFQFGLKYNQAGPGDLRTLLKEPILGRVFGRVSDWPRLKPGRTEIVVDLDSLERSDQVGVDRRRVDGSLLLKVSDTTTALQRGDRVSFRARLYPVRERRRAGFDYGRYLNLKGIGAVAYLPTLLSVEVDRRPALGFYAVVDYLRSAVRGSLDRNLSEQAAGLARGFLIGETRDIPPDIYGMFRDSGTLHLLAVSGSNVALVIFFLIWLMRPFWFSPPVRSAILLTVIVIFAGLSYGDPSVVRASIMATLVIGARLLGRTYDLNNIIAATALVILLIEPAQLFDVGFQLSFATAWGLIFITPRLTPLFKRFHDRRWYRWLVFDHVGGADLLGPDHRLLF